MQLNQVKKIKKAKILLNLAPEMKKKIDELSKKNHCTKTELIRSMIDHCIQELEGKNNG